MDAYQTYFNALKEGVVALSEAEFNEAVAPKKHEITLVKITTNAGMTLTANIHAVNIVNGRFTAQWVMRLNLIENCCYVLSVNPEMIKKVEYINV